jgi:hypothetical protein
VVLNIGIYLQNKSNDTPCSFYIDTIGRTKMYLRNKKHREANKSMAILEDIMNKLQIYENISRNYKFVNFTLSNISGIS